MNEKWYVLNWEGGGSTIEQRDVSPSEAWFSGDYRSHEPDKRSVCGVSGPFDDEKSALECLCWTKDTGITEPIICSCCGMLISLGTAGWENLVKNKLCFTCDFWTRKINSPKQLIIDAYCYSIGSEPSDIRRCNKSFLGFGGREFRIKFPDDRVLITHNLWGAGKIPERFRDRLPDNAEFIDGDKWIEMSDGTYAMGTEVG